MLEKERKIWKSKMLLRYFVYINKNKEKRPLKFQGDATKLFQRDVTRKKRIARELKVCESVRER